MGKTGERTAALRRERPRWWRSLWPWGAGLVALSALWNVLADPPAVLGAAPAIFGGVLLGFWLLERWVRVDPRRRAVTLHVLSAVGLTAAFVALMAFTRPGSTPPHGAGRTLAEALAALKLALGPIVGLSWAGLLVHWIALPGLPRRRESLPPEGLLGGRP